MPTKITTFDVSEYLNDEASIAAYLSAIVEECDTQLLLSAIGDIAKARGMSKIASESGLGRESLYKALNSNAKPRFDTILKVIEALGVTIVFNPISGNQTTRKKSSRNPACYTIQGKKHPMKKASLRVRDTGAKTNLLSQIKRKVVKFSPR
jgi:probable addiction module antidote protein